MMLEFHYNRRQSSNAQRALAWHVLLSLSPSVPFPPLTAAPLAERQSSKTRDEAAMRKHAPRWLPYTWLGATTNVVMFNRPWRWPNTWMRRKEKRGWLWLCAICPAHVVSLAKGNSAYFHCALDLDTFVTRLPDYSIVLWRAKIPSTIPPQLQATLTSTEQLQERKELRKADIATLPRIGDSRSHSSSIASSAHSNNNMEPYWSEANGQAAHPVKYESEAAVSSFPYCTESSLNFSTSATAYSEDDAEYATGRRNKTSRQDPLSHRIIEKRRRDRMNSCLADLSRLIPPQYQRKGRGRIEKTEIIEMAIRHLKHLQSECLQKETEYRSGYMDCMKEAAKFLYDSQMQEFCYRLLARLQEHIDEVFKAYILLNRHKIGTNRKVIMADLSNNGTLLRHFDGRELSKRDYCLQPQKLDGNYIQLMPHHCLETDLTNNYTSSWSAMIYYYGPIALLLIFNTTLFIKTAVRIFVQNRKNRRQLKKMEGQRNLRNLTKFLKRKSQNDASMFSQLPTTEMSLTTKAQKFSTNGSDEA
ncbi:hypothetical protein ACLKA7_008623 [Drosophila subpalustris]